MTFTRSSRPPHEKLGIDDDTRVVVLGVPPAGAADWPGRRDATPDPTAAGVDVVVVGCRSVSQVVELVPVALAMRRPGGRLWVAYHLRRRELTRTELGAAVDGLGLDLTWYRQVALADGWSAICFRRRSEFRTVNH